MWDIPYEIPTPDLKVSAIFYSVVFPLVSTKQVGLHDTAYYLSFLKQYHVETWRTGCQLGITLKKTVLL